MIQTVKIAKIANAINTIFVKDGSDPVLYFLMVCCIF